MDQDERDGIKKIHSVEVKRLRLLAEMKNEEKKFEGVKKDFASPLAVLTAGLQKIEEKIRTLALDKEREVGILKAKKDRLSKTPNKLKAAISRDVFQTQKNIDKIDEEIQKLVVQHSADKKILDAEKIKSSEHSEHVDVKAKETREEIGSLRERLSAVEEEISIIKTSLPEPLIREFYKVFDRNPMDTMVAVSEDRKCSACYLSVNPQHFIKLHEKGVFIRCAGCGRLLE